jgi:hypothetical protein
MERAGEMAVEVQPHQQVGDVRMRAPLAKLREDRHKEAACCLLLSLASCAWRGETLLLACCLLHVVCCMLPRFEKFVIRKLRACEPGRAGLSRSAVMRWRGRPLGLSAPDALLTAPAHSLHFRLDLPAACAV